MPDKYVIQRRTASGLENVAEIPALENGKVDLSWLPVVGAMGSAIIERGSNANGEYIRWADGTQVCMYYGRVAQADNSSAGKTFTFPAVFVSGATTRLVCSPSGIISTSSHATTVVESGVLTASQYVVKILVPSNGDVIASTATLGFYAIAIGRWK